VQHCRLPPKLGVAKKYKVHSVLQLVKDAFVPYQPEQNRSQRTKISTNITFKKKRLSCAMNLSGIIATRSGGVGLFGGRASWRRNLRVSYRSLLVGVLLATHVLVPALLAQNFEKIYAQAAVSTVKILTPTKKGLGVAIADGTILVTCYHVVDDNEEVTLETGLGQFKGRVMGSVPEEDISFVEIIGTRLVPVKVCRSPDNPMDSTFASVIGMPERPMQMDIRNGKVTNIFIGSFTNFFVSAKPDLGFSGGPVLEKDGFFIGMTRAILGWDGRTGAEVVPAWKIIDAAKVVSEKKTPRPAFVPLSRPVW